MKTIHAMMHLNKVNYLTKLASIVHLLCFFLLVNTHSIHAETAVAGDLAPRNSTDGQLNAGDLLILESFVLSNEIPTNTETQIGDVAPLNNPDGILDAGDIAVLIQSIFGLVVLPPVVIDPVITDFNPKTANIGDLINITGEHFSSLTTPVVTLNQQGGSTLQAPVTSSNSTSIDFTIPAGTDTGFVTVTVDGESVVSVDTLEITPSSTFTMLATPALVSVIEGQSVSYAITLDSINGFSQLATLSVTGLPTGITYAFNPPQLAVGQTSLLTVSASMGQSVSSSLVSIDASAIVDGFNLNESIGVTLDVQLESTSFLGQAVIDDAGQTPLEGVTITFLGVDGDGNATGCSGSTTSDAAGNFSFSNLGVECTGGQLIRYNGTTVTGQPGTYAGVDLFYNIVDGVVTVSPVLIHLPRLDDKEIVCIEENAATDKTYTFNTIPNLSTEVYAGTTFAPHPSYPPPTGVCAAGEFPLIAVDVPVDRLPDAMPPDPTAVEPFIVAFQPANTIASQPVAVSFPNLLNTAPGINMELTTLDPTKGVMVIYGTGTVSNDGLQIVPDFDPANPGQRYGLVHFDWHGPRVPPDPNNADDISSDCNRARTKFPVDLSSGIEVINETDISISGLRGDLSLERTYRTLSNQAGPFGIGSNHNYGFRLDTNTPATAAQINLIMPDGSRFPYALNGGGTYTNTNICKLRGSVMSIDSGGEVDLRWKNGTVYHFTLSTAALGSILESITDANGNATALTRNPSNDNQITEITDPVGRKLSLSYDGTNRITQVIDPLGRRVKYTYNGFGTLETVKDPAGGITRYDYSAADELTQITDARGVVIVQNAYNADGRVIQQTHADTGVLMLDYILANPAAGANSPVLETIVTDPLGYTTTYRFNQQGYVIDVTDAVGQVRLFEREPGSNKLLSLTGNGQCDVCGDSSLGDQFFTYDANGNRLTVTDVLGHTTTMTYEPVFNKVSTITDHLTNTTTFAYDPSGNLLTVTDPLTNITTFTYDTSGLPLTITDPLPAQWSLTYDSNGNLRTITDPSINVNTIEYDLLSRPVQVKDARGERTLLVYDSLDRPTVVTDARGNVTQAAYDAIDNLLTITDARNNATNFDYDDIGQLQARTDSLGLADNRVYDLNGNLTSFTDRKGQLTTLSYDALNRLVTIAYDDGNTVTRSYDSYGRLIQAVDSLSGVFAIDYDTAGRLTGSTGSTGTVNYQYDVLNRTSQRQVVGQSAVGYTYDDAGNQKTISSPQASISYTYNNRNLISNELRGNGVETDYIYDSLGRVLSIVHSKGATIYDTQTYIYGAAGNITQKTAAVAQPLTTQASVNSYDTTSNRLTQWGSTTYTHDNNGNRLTENGVGGTTTYSWDARNRLQSLTNATLEMKDFGYDYAANLIEEITYGTAPSSTRSYVLDDLTNVAQLNDAPGKQLSILSGQGIDQHFSVTDGSGVTEYGLTDQINSTTQVVDDIGLSQGQSFYEPFGETSSTGVSYPFGFTGRVPVMSNIYHYRARYLDSVSGRFISEDPIGISGGDVNYYRYVGNNSLVFIDPFGLKQISREESRKLIENAESSFKSCLAIFNVAICGYANFGGCEIYDFRCHENKNREKYTFVIPGHECLGPVTAGDFGNYVAGYATSSAMGRLGTFLTKIGGKFYAGQVGEVDDTTFIDIGARDAQR